MIIVKCPKCERKLSVEDAKAGGVSACPDCGQRFRIPDTRARTPEKPSAKQPRAAVSQRQPARKEESAAKHAPKPPRRPGDSWMYEDSSPYAVTPDAEPAPAPKKRRPPSSDNDDDLDPATYSFDKEYTKQRKRRIKEQQREAVRRNIIFFSVMVLVWVGLGIYAYLQPAWAIIPYGCGTLISVVGGIWLVALAFKDNAGTGFLVLLVPFYHLYFAIKNFDRAARPLALAYIGSFISVTALIIGGVQLFNRLKIEHTSLPHPTSTVVEFTAR